MYDREVLKALAGLGVELHLLLPAGAPVKPAPGWALHLTRRHLWNYYEYNWLFLGRVLRLRRRPGFDLLRIHSLTLAPLGWLVQRLARCPVTAQVHHVEAGRPAERLEGAFLRGCRLVTTLSRFSSQQLVQAYRLAPERIRIVPPGVDPKYCPQPPDERLQARLGLSGRPALFYLGSLIPRKNLLVLLEAFQKVHHSIPPARLVLGGRGPQEGELRARAAELGILDAVIFAGEVPEQEKVAYYNLADVYLLPSRLEGFGMSAAEAMACGKPVVAANAASLPEVIVDGVTGCLAGPDRPDDFAGAILRLLHDEPLRRALGQAGRARAITQFSWEVSAKKLQQSYEEIIMM